MYIANKDNHLSYVKIKKKYSEICCGVQLYKFGRNWFSKPARKKSQHGCVRWALCEHLTSPCHDFACGGLRGGRKVNKIDKHSSRDSIYPNPKINFDQFSRHFKQFGTTLIFLSFDRIFVTPFSGG